MTGTSIDDDRFAVEQLARANLEIIASGQTDLIADNVGEQFWDMQGGDTPETTRAHGPTAFAATVSWLRSTFTDIRFEIHRAFVDGDRAVLYVTMHARQHGPFVVPNADGPELRFPSHGRSCHVRSVHMFRIADGRVVEHDAVRDDMVLARQLGWIPSGPPPGRPS